MYYVISDISSHSKSTSQDIIRECGGGTRQVELQSRIGESLYQIDKYDGQTVERVQGALQTKMFSAGLVKISGRATQWKS